MAAKLHVEEIRRTKFSIGGEPNPLTEDLHQAVKNLSAELYAKDVHFLMELIQLQIYSSTNAEDNEYPEGVDPSLEFVITSKDITNTGAPATLLVFNNEKGFSRKNVESICSVGRSTKKGLRKRGYIGEKGIGFKSVFLITSQPYIFSNGYQIRFSEKPCQKCNVGYIVPEWVDGPMLSAIRSVYGSSTALPTTTLVLPLKPEKVKPVKDQLSCIHPEVLLFLSKIKRLSVREVNEDPRLNSVSAIAISSEKNFVTLKSMDAESYTLHLTANLSGKHDDTECGYYMWKQRFPVKQENKVEVRSEVDEWVVTLAFPNGKRLNRGASMPGIYSFLPTETVTNFPFIIQADFLLASSRENILWDNKWNRGILDCVPVAFLNSFTALIKSSVNAPVSSLPNQFRFLPVKESSHSKLNLVRDAIKAKLLNETIVPCESYTGQKLFRKPNEVGRLKPAFWSILNSARSQGVSFSNISSHGTYVVACSFDQEVYKSILEFLEIQFVGNEWYAKCIAGSNLVRGVSEKLYVQLLVFIAENWRSGSSFYMTNMKNIPVIKYVGMDGKVNYFKISACENKLLAADADQISWLINWNTEFHSSTDQFFIPAVTQKGIRSCLKEHSLKKWLVDEVKVEFVTVSEYASNLIPSVKYDRKLAVTFAHFLYHSLEKDYLWNHEVEDICSTMPIVDNYGQVTVRRKGVLLPAHGSKWVELIGSNTWRQHNYVELGEDYTRSVTYCGNYASGENLLNFMKKYVEASDLPDLHPPNAVVPTMSSPLTKKNTFLLLQWLNNLKRKNVTLPDRFLSSIKNGSWLKTSLSGCRGYKPPSESFMLESSSGKVLQNGSVLVDIPLVDVEFYGHQLKTYKEELQIIGVRFEIKEACELIGKRFMSLVASSKLTGDIVVSILNFIRYLGAHYISSKELIDTIKEGKWVRTCRGDMILSNSVLFSHEWDAASLLSDIPFMDKDYYGSGLLSFKKELELLGVVVKFDQTRYQLVSDNLKSSSALASLSSEAMLLLLKCIEKLESPDKMVQAIKNSKCLKTNLGYRCPSECFLVTSESEWGCLLRVFGSFPVLDEGFYGSSILSMEKELKKVGVVTDFEDAAKEFTRAFKQHALISSFTKENVLLFLECFRKLKKVKVKFPEDLKKCIREEKWIRTKLGDYRSPNECILFATDWEPISLISVLPFIDDSFYGGGICDYRVELKLLGVTTDFKDGAKFVAAGLRLPESSSSITPASVYALLDSVKSLKESASFNLEESKSEVFKKFLDKLSKKDWLRTHFGFKRPNECLFLHADWNPFLKHDDAPFIDEQFYGSRIRSYNEVLELLKVTTDVNKGCRLVASYLNSQSNFERINRFYNYLSEFKWEPTADDAKSIWIPRGTDNGEWVTPQECVLHDKNNLFDCQLNVLEKFQYEKKILNFFAHIFNVNVHPSVDDYCELWKKWEASGTQITHTECCAFWEFVVHHWNKKSEETFNKSLTKLPVTSPSSDGILISYKRDVFIGDDLFLTDLFQSCSRSIFVWYPEPSSKTLTRIKLVDIYKKLGVRTISESAQKKLSDLDDVKLETVDLKEKILKKGLLKLILGFLADPSLKLDTARRHEAVTRMLGLEAFETVDPMTINYSLSLSCGDEVNVEAKRMIRWDKQNSKLFMQKMEEGGGRKNILEYATHFAEVIAEGMLCESEELVPQLSELIKLGFLVEFDEEAIEFLMKIKNLQMYPEDNDYLSSIFSC